MVFLEFDAQTGDGRATSMAAGHGSPAAEDGSGDRAAPAVTVPSPVSKTTRSERPVNQK
jgi:hypothetical protein